METKLCRLCGKLTDNYVNIFKTEGFKTKVETCLPVVLCQHTLLPDTVCKQCQESIDIFYGFMKNCLQSIIILEKQLDVTDSCLKSRRKSDKGVSVHLKPVTSETAVQTNCEELSSKLREHILEAKQLLTCKVPEYPLVDYEVSDESNAEPSSGFGRQFFDNQENRILKEIAEKISLKRKGDEILPVKPKICKYDSSRRKTRPPKRIEVAPVVENSEDAWVSRDGLVCENGECVEAGGFDNSQEDQKLPLSQLPQMCFLCDSSFENAGVLATHVFELHGIDMAQVIASGAGPTDTKKALPKLVKIINNRAKPDKQDTSINDTTDNFTCPTCQSVHSTESDMLDHIRQYHPHKLALACGLCKHLSSTYSDLTSHLETCLLEFPPQTRYSCLVCRFNDDNVKTVENHVSIHQFILENCKKANKMFDPSDYVEVNESCPKVYSCDECSEGFSSFKEFSAHRRAKHEIFHCDLCGKFYGRNSHLWKHVNRLHKGNPIVTCQICYKTSASKYHLSVHFGKIHGVKNAQNDDFMSKKFEGFDFQSVKQSFLRQELLRTSTSDETSEEPEEKSLPLNKGLPKEIDTSSKVYTNIITNYTPPTNEGEFKCPKCAKGFHKKNLLKKHKKNCRPRLQKDLLTRCKSCSRIFKDRQSLTKHLINYHTEYNCEICDQKFQSKCEIIAHIRFGHPNCDELICKCGAILRTRKEFKTHKSDHKNSFICYFCGDNLASTVRLKMHVLSLHRTILSLSCGVCLKLFETQHILRDHVRLAHRERLTKQNTCTVCGKTYATRWKAYDHMNKSHGKIFKACKECLNVFTSPDELEAHYKTTHYEKPKCESEESPISDNEEYNNKSILEKRLTKKKSMANAANIENSSKRTVYENGDDPALCEICLKTWPAKKHLWQHYIRCHKTVAATVCGICLKANDSYENLQEHLQERHANLLHGQGYGSNFICRICGRYHNASSKLKLHMAIHENFEWSMIERFEKKSTPELEIKSEEINFESLIEEVEESDTDRSKSSERSDDVSDVSDDEDSEFLKNEMVLTEEEDTSNSSFREIKREVSPIDDEEEKLTSAIRSICYEQKFKEDVEVEMDFTEIQVQALNSHEIQTAVDSIL